MAFICLHLATMPGAAHGEPKLKRIVDGLTYNTNTSTLLAKAEWELEDQWSPYNGAECEGELYQTRGGAFFLVTTIHTKDADGEPRDKVELAPMTAERAQAWLLEGDVEVYRNPFGDPPEAEAEAETGATIYLRVPAALKRDADEAAREAELSGNAWALRCVERCLEGFPKEMTAIWSIARGLVAPWYGDKFGQDTELDSYKLTTAVKALDEIGDLVGSFARSRFGTDDLHQIPEADWFLCRPEGADLNRRFQPYPTDPYPTD
jgi:hypothetical protein